MRSLIILLLVASQLLLGCATPAPSADPQPQDAGSTPPPTPAPSRTIEMGTFDAATGQFTGYKTGVRYESLADLCPKGPQGCSVLGPEHYEGDWLFQTRVVGNKVEFRRIFAPEVYAYQVLLSFMVRNAGPGLFEVTANEVEQSAPSGEGGLSINTREASVVNWTVRAGGRSYSDVMRIRRPKWPTWTFMVYLNGDNNLEEDAIADFEEMARVGSNAKLNIVVQMDRAPGYSVSYGNWTGTRRFLVQAGDTPIDTAGVDMGELNMGDPAVLTDFIKWSVDKYPADHYILVIWNHGGGWRFHQELIAEAEARRRAEGHPGTLGFKQVSRDDTDGRDALYTQEVGQALEDAGQKLDIVGFDACLMGMIEVAYQIEEHTDFMVASEETEPGQGWPYDTILNDLVTSGESRVPAKLAESIVDRYGESMDAAGDETLAAYDLSQTDGVVDALKSFVEAHNALAADEKAWPEIGAARAEMEEFHPRWAWCCWGVDMGDLATEISARVESNDVQAALSALELAIDRFVIANYHGSGHPEAGSVAIYFPPDDRAYDNDPDHDGYQDDNLNYPVAFVKDFQWDNWLREQYLVQFPGGD